MTRRHHILPTFLGIGAQRSGTTWLDAQLRRHPEIFLPVQRKEVHFFDKHYAKGINWYSDFFRDADPRRKVGEITPAYLYSPLAPYRISRHMPHIKLMVILRNPADRAYSQYGLYLAQGAKSHSFESFIEEHPELYYRGLYAHQLSRYTKLFPPRQLCVLIFEEVMKDRRTALARICRFLEVDEQHISAEGIDDRIGRSQVARYAFARRITNRASRQLRAIDLDWVVNSAKRMNMQSLFASTTRTIPPLTLEIRRDLIHSYEDEFQRLEEVLGRPLDLWRV